MTSAPLSTLAEWSGALIAAACSDAYRAYEQERSRSYRAYFAAHPELRARHPMLAKDVAAALPDGWAHLADFVAPEDRHRWHLSGKSSQTLALGLLGVAGTLDPSLQWLFNGLGLAPPTATAHPQARFEYTVSPELLGERPRQTSVDFVVDAPDALICLEAKWAEEGMGACGCAREGGDPTTGRCSSRVLPREPYWAALNDELGLPGAGDGQPCPLSFTYQAARNIAAAKALAQPGQTPVFALVYDARNPYFGGHGDWPGWPVALHDALAGAPSVTFASASWQDLAAEMPLDAAAREWAVEKHALDSAA